MNYEMVKKGRIRKNVRKNVRQTEEWEPNKGNKKQDITFTPNVLEAFWDWIGFVKINSPAVGRSPPKHAR